MAATTETQNHHCDGSLTKPTIRQYIRYGPETSERNLSVAIVLGLPIQNQSEYAANATQNNPQLIIEISEPLVNRAHCIDRLIPIMQIFKNELL